MKYLLFIFLASCTISKKVDFHYSKYYMKQEGSDLFAFSREIKVVKPGTAKVGEVKVLDDIHGIAQGIECFHMIYF